jgi:hypothetical protein
MNQAENKLGEETWPQNEMKVTLQDISVIMEALARGSDYHSNLVEFCIEKIVHMADHGQSFRYDECIMAILKSAIKMVEKHSIDFKTDAKLAILIEWCLKIAVVQNGCTDIAISHYIYRMICQNLDRGEQVMQVVNSIIPENNIQM